MGVDFTMQCVKPINRKKFERLRDEEDTYFTRRDHFLWDLFRTDLNQEIQNALTKKVSFDWYDKRFNGLEKEMELTLDICYDPRIVLECIEEVWVTILKINSKLPISFSISKKNTKYSWTNSEDIFYNGKPYYVDDEGWGELIARPKSNKKGWESNNGPEIDLSDKTEFNCNDCINFKDENGDWTVREGPKITLYIKKNSFAEEHKFMIEQMIAVCENAIKNDYLILTHIS
jgi:hypothetical protein